MPEASTYQRGIGLVDLLEQLKSGRNIPADLGVDANYFRWSVKEIYLDCV